jgi:hypothetical protein
MRDAGNGGGAVDSREQHELMEDAAEAATPIAAPDAWRDPQSV